MKPSLGEFFSTVLGVFLLQQLYYCFSYW